LDILTGDKTGVDGAVESAMPIYFFDVEEGEHLTHDSDGSEFADPQQARDAAVRVLPDLAKEALPLTERCDLQVKVRDKDGRYICAVTLSLVAKWLA
jgi:hypothetical protein